MQYVYLADRDEMQEHAECVPLSGIDRYGIHYTSKCGRCYGQGGYDFFLYMLPANAKWPEYPKDLLALDEAVEKHNGIFRTNPESFELMPS